MTDRRLVWRMVFVVLVMGVAWTGLSMRLNHLHLGDNEDLHDLIQARYDQEKEILVGRGRVYSGNGATLAQDLNTRDIWVDPQEILKNGQMQTVATQLARALDIPRDEVLEKINRPSKKFRYVERYVRHEQFERVERMQLKGVYMDDSSARYYPSESSLCHVVGFSNLDGIGCAGVEYQMNTYLQGTPGLRVSEHDRKGREVYSRRIVEITPQKGCNVYLTIDMYVQYIVEEALAAAVNEHNAKGAWAVVQEVRTGRILAMASLPQFNLNEYGSVHDEQKMNRVIGYTYEPGSTMKAAILAAAFNERIVSPNTPIDCEHGTWYYKGRPLRDFHPYGILSVKDVLKKSSNIGTAKIALQLGSERLERYLRDFGIGRRAGIDLPGEQAGIFWPRSKWDSLTISRVPMGHGVAVTALQMVGMYSAIANDGYLMRPRIVDKVVDAAGTVVYQSEKAVVSQPIRTETSRLMRRLLKRVADDGGTARRARIEGYDIAGKTGTAEKVINGRYAPHANIASFVGFLPAENPEICILAVVDEPQKFHTGGAVAGPVFKSIAEQAVRYLGILPGGLDEPYRVGVDQVTQIQSSQGQFRVP